MVDRPGRQVDDLYAWRLDRERARRVRKPNDGIGVRDVQVLADERHAERRVQVRQQHHASFGDAVTVGVAQERDAIRARHRAAGLFLVVLEEPALDPLVVVGPLRRVRLGHEYVAVRQDVQPPRVMEVPREGRHRRALGPDGPAPVRPSLRLHDVDDGDERRVRCRDPGTRAYTGRHRQARGGTACYGRGRYGRGEDSPRMSQPCHALHGGQISSRIR